MLRDFRISELRTLLNSVTQEEEVLQNKNAISIIVFSIVEKQ